MSNPHVDSGASDLTGTSSSPIKSAPTKVRYAMVMVATLVAVLLYLDRICMSTAAGSVAQDLKIQKPDLDNVLGAFFLTYALGQLPAGWLGDRFGARWMLGAYIVLWSLSTGLMGFAGSLSTVLILRLACGLFEAGAYPVAAGIVRRWVPINRRGIASSMIAVGGRLGGALAPVLTIQMMLWWTLGSDWWTAPEDATAAITSWRPVMIFYGAIGIVIAGIFMWFFRDWPQEHPLVNAAELELIRHRDVPMVRTTSATSEAPPIMAMLMSVPMWLNSFVQFASNIGWAFLVTKMPQYLEEVYQTTQQNQGWLQSLPLAAGIGGLFLGGFFTDFLTHTFGLRWGRSLAMATSRLLVGISLLAIMMVDTALGATICLTVLGLSTDLGTPAVWAFGQDVGGRHVGSAVGWANMWGNFGAALSPKFFGLIVASAGSAAVGWQYAFIACAAINVVAGIACLGINASKPLKA